MAKSPSRPSEDELIARFFAPMAGEGGLGLRDDAARLAPAPGHDLVLTVDGLTAGVHFLDDRPRSIAHKALAVNLSDLAAKGAEPSGFLLTLALPDDWTEAWLRDFTDGLAEAAEAFRCPLLGGDTVRASGPLWLSVTALGQVPAGRMVPRGGARPGDRVCVTGTIGDAALGLVLRRVERPPWAAGLRPEDRDALVDRYLHPRPRLAVAGALRAHASAAMDVSDGLAGDLAKMMRASGTTARIDLEAVPISPAARAALAAEPGLLDRLVTGGDDYEILCTVPDSRLQAFLSEAAGAGVAAAAIGIVEDGQGLPVFVDDEVERRYQQGSFSHF